MAAAGRVPSHFFIVCWKRSTFPQVVGWLGREFFCRTRSRTSSFSRPLREVRPPWAKLYAVNANTGQILWESTLGLNTNLPEGKQLAGSGGSAGPTATAC